MGDHELKYEAREQFRLVYDATYRHVLAYALRRARSVSAADDVVAETYLTAWRRWTSVPKGDHALPWLYGVARRVLANQRRSEDRQVRLFYRAGHEVPASADVEWEVLTADMGRRALRALRLLSADEQELLCLVAWEQLSHRQIATVLNCSENAVAIRVHRARTKLRTQMTYVKGRESPGHIQMNPALTEGDAS